MTASVSGAAWRGRGRGVRPFHDVDERMTRCDVESMCTRRVFERAAVKVKDRRRSRGDEAVRRVVEEIRTAELVGTSAASVVPGFQRAFECARVAMGSA